MTFVVEHCSAISPSAVDMDPVAVTCGHFLLEHVTHHVMTIRLYTSGEDLSHRSKSTNPD
jgi:hypothetical protein